MKWHDLRQQGFLTLAIVLMSGVLVSILIPNLDFRGALILIALVAFLIGWVP
jgi:hypothetical protein